MRRDLAVGALAFGLGVTMLSAHTAAAPLSDSVVVAIEPPSSTVVLGGHLDLQVSVTNNGIDASPPLVVHIDITKPDEATSVDPEDWTSTLSKPIGVVESGRTVVVDWTIQPISAGTFATYAVVLSPGVDTIAASNVLEVRVTDQRSLDPGGIVPVAVAVPVLVGALLAFQMRLARRRRQPTDRNPAELRPEQPART